MLLLLVTEALNQTGLSKKGMYSLTNLAGLRGAVLSFWHSWIPGS